MSGDSSEVKAADSSAQDAHVSQPAASADAGSNTRSESDALSSELQSAELQSGEQLAFVDPVALGVAKIKFKLDGGATAFSIKSMADGAKLIDADEKELARFNLQDNKLKIKDGTDQVIAYLIMSKDRIHVEDAQQSKRLWKLQQQTDGDWKLEDGLEQLMTRLKKRDYGWELETADDRSLGKVKLKSGKTSLRNAQEETTLYTKDPVPTLAVACLGLEKIEDSKIRAGLAVAVCIMSEE